MEQAWTRPRALRLGDLVAVCAPAGSVEADRLQAGVAALESLGFGVRVPDGVLEKTGFTAGSVERRLRELHALFEDDEVAGIVCARGGAGAAKLLARLDADLVRANPKVFLGYSDVTFLHLFLNAQRLVTFHGPMVARDLAAGAFDRESLLWAVSGEGQPYASAPDDLLSVRDGSAEGRLLGGCLSILAAAAGTRWTLRTDLEPVILFLEDVNEPPYRIDRMLFQLREAGALSGVRGVVFGDMRGCAPRREEGYTLEDVILSALEGLDIPVALGLSSGHTSSPNVTLPLGTRVRLSCADGEARFEVLERSVE